MPTAATRSAFISARIAAATFIGKVKGFRMNTVSRWLFRGSRVCVPDLLGLRGVDASLGQIAVRNKSFRERPTFGEPLMRHYFCFWHLCGIARSRIDVRFRWNSGRAADITSKNIAALRPLEIPQCSRSPALARCGIFRVGSTGDVAIEKAR